MDEWADVPPCEHRKRGTVPRGPYDKPVRLCALAFQGKGVVDVRQCGGCRILGGGLAAPPGTTVRTVLDCPPTVYYMYLCARCRLPLRKDAEEQPVLPCPRCEGLQGAEAEEPQT